MMKGRGMTERCEGMVKWNFHQGTFFQHEFVSWRRFDKTPNGFPTRKCSSSARIETTRLRLVVEI